MNLNDAAATEDHLSHLLAAYDEALATGQPLTDVQRPTLDAEAAARLLEDQDCLELLERLWPRRAAASASVPLQQLGRFRLVRELGRGGFGIVYLAEDPSLGRRVALKVPRPEVLLTPEFRQRFLREAKAAACLDHSNLVPMHEAGEDGPLCYLVSAYCEGPTLQRWLDEQARPVPPRDAARLVATLAKAVAYMHGRGVHHRDLKPSNILLVRANHDRQAQDAAAGGGRPPGAAALGRVAPAPDSGLAALTPRITDFGLARLADGGTPETRSGLLMGTPMYMAPEQAEGRSSAIGPATDVYALGVLLYELLTGRPPLQGQNDVDTLRRIVAEEPVPPTWLRPGLARDLEAVCLQCLEKEPHRRYAGAAALGRDLNDWLDGKPIQARPAGVARRALKWARRRPTTAALLAVSAAALVAVLAGVGWHSVELGKINNELEKANGDLATANTDLRALAARERQQALHLRRLLYVNEFKLSVRAWQKGEHAQVVERLDDLRPGAGAEELRGFEWYYLKGQCHPFHAVWRGHQTSVHSVAVSGDGRTVATGGSDGTVRLWDVTTGETRAVLAGHAGGVNLAAFSPDGRTLASGSQDGNTIWIWDVSTGQERTRFSVGPTLRNFAFTADGKRLVVGCADGVGFRDVATGKAAPGFLKQPTHDLAVAPDGRTFATANADRTVRLWDLPSRRELQALRGHDHGATRVAFSPDGRTLASWAWRWGDSRFNLWDVATGELRWTLQGPRFMVWSVAFAPDSKTLATTALQDRSKPARVYEIKLWDVATGTPLPCSFERSLGQVRALAFLPTGRRLVLGCADNTVKLLDTSPKPERKPLPGHAPAETWALAFAPDGRTLASGGDDRLVRLWDLGDGRQQKLSGHGALVSAVVFSPDGRTVASTSYDRSVKLWDAGTGRPRATLKGAADTLRCVAFAPDGRLLAAGGRDKTVRIWDADTGRELASLEGHGKEVRGVAFSPDGTVLASASEDGKVRLWDTASRRLRQSLDDTDQVLCLAFAPDGKTLAWGNEAGIVRLWDVTGGRERAALKGHVNQVHALAFAPDGRTLATAGDDKTVRLWQVSTGAELLVLEGHVTRVNAVAFARDGQTLASAGHDGAIRLWQAPRADE